MTAITISDAATFSQTVSTTTSAPNTALITGDTDAHSRRWTEVRDRLLDWKSHPESVLYDGFDPLDPRCVDTAIDLAVDLEESHCLPPTAYAPTADGGVSFEWRTGSHLREIEIVGQGRAEYIEIQGGRVIRHGTIARDPVTRRLERLMSESTQTNT